MRENIILEVMSHWLVGLQLESVHGHLDRTNLMDFVKMSYKESVCLKSTNI